MLLFSSESECVSLYSLSLSDLDCCCCCIGCSDYCCYSLGDSQKKSWCVFRVYRHYNRQEFKNIWLKVFRDRHQFQFHHRNLLRCDVKYVMWSNVCLEWTVIYKLTRKCIICIRILLDFYNSSFAFFLLVSYHKYSHYFSDKRKGTNDSVVSIIISMTHGWYIS